MMKNINFKIVLLLFFSFQQFFVRGQSVPNGGFESGSNSPTCNNLNGLSNWFFPHCWFGCSATEPAWVSDICTGYGTSGCSNGLGHLSLPPSARFLKITGHNVNMNSDDEIGVFLGTPLLAYTQYTIRFKIAPLACDIGGNNLRVYVAQNTNDWASSGDKMEAINANVHIARSPYGATTTWYQVERNFTTNGSTQMENLILQCDLGAFYIDDVEFVQRCASGRSIANVNYLGPANNFPYLNYGIFDEGANTFNAGPNVTLQPTSDVHYAAGGTITLSDGFTALYGSTFNATIAACNMARMGTHEPEQVVKKPVAVSPSVSYRNTISVQPNPFESQTEFSYSIEKESNVSIEVFNTFGQNMGTLVKNEKHPAGAFNILFEAKHLASGIYFYVFQVNGVQETKRIVISK
jgi:hypothetical protein